MPQIELEHRTSLSAPEIKEKAGKLIQGALEEFKDKISDAQQEWRGNTLFFSFRAMGFSVSGEAVVQNNLITVRAKLPFAATMFKGKIRDKFSEKARELFP
jgi:hypothetical protein